MRHTQKLLSKHAPESLAHFYKYCISHSFPFAFYRLPGTEIVKVLAQQTTTLHKLKPGTDYSKREGFVFAPFVPNTKAATFIIEPEIFWSEKYLPQFGPPKPHVFKHKTTDDDEPVKDSPEKKAYLQLVGSIQKSIEAGKHTKIVAARTITKDKPEGFNDLAFFRALCKKYPRAFISLVYTKQYGLWIGASPEILLEHSGSEFKTYSLAGTKANTPANKQTPWGKKEVEEQQIVTEYIADCLKKVMKKTEVSQKTDTVAAGNILHLRTTFSFEAETPARWQKLVEELHPTPAVAGLPKTAAVKFIAANEKAPRGFYCGYLGPVNMDAQINLYVNLRCMQVLDKKLTIYVGCGITAHSKPEDEWKETEIKSETLLSVL